MVDVNIIRYNTEIIRQSNLFFQQTRLKVNAWRHSLYKQFAMLEDIFILDRPSCSKSKMRGKKQILQFAAKRNPGLRGLLRVGDDILT